MSDDSVGKLRFTIRVSLFVGLIYSLFEGISYYISFPLHNTIGGIELMLRNSAIFFGAGLVTHFLFSCLGRFLKGLFPDAIPFVLSILILFPVYFFLFDLLEGTGYLYRLSGNTKTIALLLALFHLILFILLSRIVVANGSKRYIGLLLSIFFFINVGHLLTGRRLLTQSESSSYLSFFVIALITVAIYFATGKVQKVFLRDEYLFGQRVNLRMPVLLVLGLGIIYTLMIKFQGTRQTGFHSLRHRANVVLIVLDTARADRFSCYGYWRDTTPFLRSFIEDATLYREATSPAPWTIPGHASIFTGLYPSAHGSTWKSQYLDDRFLTIPEFLASRGYVTVGISNNPAVNKANGLGQGFENYVEMWRNDVFNPTFYYRLDWFLKRFLRQNDGGALRTNQWVMEWFDRIYRGNRPFFLFVNLMECHLGHDAPDDFHERFLREEYSPTVRDFHDNDIYPLLTGVISMTDQDWRDYGDIYDGDLLYLDRRLEELYHFLEEGSLLDNTIVIITSDHGEHLGEHGLLSHLLSLYEPLLQVPLIVRVPEGLPELPQIQGPVQTVDIYPTLLHLLGFEDEAVESHFQGFSLVGKESTPHSFIVAEHEPPKGRISRFLEEHPERTSILRYDRTLKALRVDSLKYIWSSNGNPELYDLSADPGEIRDLRDEWLDEAKTFEDRLMSWLDSFEHAEVSGEGEMKIDSETRQRLRALGYVD